MNRFKKNTSKSALWAAICQEVAEMKGLDKTAGDSSETQEPPNQKTCLPATYLEYYILPVLLNGIEAMLKEAEIELCLEYKFTKFNPLDYLTEYLYNYNLDYPARPFTPLHAIPFVKDWSNKHPRDPLPTWMLISKTEAAAKIQSLMRGYLLRKEQPEIREMRTFWQTLCEEKEKFSKEKEVKEIENFEMEAPEKEAAQD